MQSLKTAHAETGRGHSLLTCLFLLFYAGLSVEKVERPQDCMLEEVCSRQDLARGVDAS